jgi:N-acetylglucosaminyldiphosphoundecaprenol N-acetyl-beta-D-mannosaminyltransferase
LTPLQKAHVVHERSDNTQAEPCGSEVAVLGARVASLTMDAALSRIGRWAGEAQPAVVCFTNAHSLVTAHRDPALARALADADLCLPDGAPVAWMLSHLLGRPQPRVPGPDLMWAYLGEAARRDESVFLYGGSPTVLEGLQRRLTSAFPGLVIAGACSPPFRPLTPDEDNEVTRRINESGARTVWVGLGCPKQELWMHEHRSKVQAVMLGVGAAFDFHAGTLPRAPNWMHGRGLEWLHRLSREPRRLWRRYLVTNSLFVGLAVRQLAALALRRNS